MTQPPTCPTLYVIRACQAPPDEVHTWLGTNDADAMLYGTWIAARDIVLQWGFSTYAQVYRLTTRGLEHVGTAWAIDAPTDWEWAHPLVDEHAEDEAGMNAGLVEGVDPDDTGPAPFPFAQPPPGPASWDLPTERN